MIEILSTNDPIRLHFLRVLLEDAGIAAAVFDGGGPWPGAFPGRLMVPAGDVELARRLMRQAEEPS
jgi:hypothetical protein